MIYQRAELRELAGNTVAKSERILRNLVGREEMVAGNRTLDSGMKNIVRDMRNLLRFSEEKLKEAKDKVKNAKELKLIYTWKDAVTSVAVEVFEDNLNDRAEKDDQLLFEEIEELIYDGDITYIYETFDRLKDDAQNYEAFSYEEINAIVRRFIFTTP